MYTSRALAEARLLTSKTAVGRPPPPRIASDKDDIFPGVQLSQGAITFAKCRSSTIFAKIQSLTLMRTIPKVCCLPHRTSEYLKLIEERA